VTDVTARKAEPFVRLAVNISQALRDRLELTSEKVDESMSDYVRKAIEERLDRDET
jgi:predicted DNA-binding protein